MSETIKAERRGNSRFTTERVVRYAAGAILAPLALVAPAHAKPKKETPVQRTAERLEYRIAHDMRVRFDASNTIYWSRRGDEDDNFDFRTTVPLTGRVGKLHELRYFGVRQRGKTRRSIDVFPIPRGELRAQSKYDAIHNCGEEPGSIGRVSLTGENKVPTVVIEYETEEASKRAQLGKTRSFNRDIILVPPVIFPDPDCRDRPTK